MPVRVELGPQDLEQKACVLARRDLPGKEGKTMGVPLADAPAKIVALLKEIQNEPVRAGQEISRRQQLRGRIPTTSSKQKIEEPGGFLWAHWDGTRETEDRIAAETKATIRCIPFNRAKEAGKCMVTGQPSAGGWCSRRRIEHDQPHQASSHPPR